MAALADYAHQNGLKFGLYSGTRIQTILLSCGKMQVTKPVLDALVLLDMKVSMLVLMQVIILFALTHFPAWNVDYLKYDNCNSDGTPPEVFYRENVSNIL